MNHNILHSRQRCDSIWNEIPPLAAWWLRYKNWYPLFKWPARPVSVAKTDIDPYRSNFSSYNLPKSKFSSADSCAQPPSLRLSTDESCLLGVGNADFEELKVGRLQRHRRMNDGKSEVIQIVIAGQSSISRKRLRRRRNRFAEPTLENNIFVNRCMTWSEAEKTSFQNTEVGAGIL
jgi:hypothetical protein